jgi:hypothetical protein
VEWLEETFNLLSRGGGMVITAIFRLGLVALGLFVAYRFIREFFRNPVEIGRRTLAVVLALVIGFGTIIVVPKYIYPIEGWWVGALWIAGWIVAGKIAILVGGLKDEAKIDTGPSQDPKRPTS